jgi:hypothetical protein
MHESLFEHGADLPQRVLELAVAPVVVLPDPFMPRNPVTRPGAAVKVTSRTAWARPYLFVSASISMVIAARP